MRNVLIGFAGLAAASVLCASDAAAQVRPTPPPMIQVSAEGRASAPPDMATLRIGVETREERASRALAANSAATAEVIASLRRAGVEGRDIQTSGLFVNPVYPSSGSYAKSASIDGYVVVNEVTARIRDLDGLGGVLDAAVTAGANRINGLSFDIADPEPLLAQARADAVARASDAARTYAAAAGLSLGPILSITDGTSAASPVGPAGAMLRMEAASVPIERGESTIMARTSIVWALAPLP